MKQKTRLDAYLYEKGYCISRSRARDAILRGAVKVNGCVVTKAGFPVSEEMSLIVEDLAEGYVCRAALKLRGALERFGLSLQNKTALDIGCSTGGFTQVLLERGALSVIAIDVGHDQFSPSLREDPRIILYEGLNARDLKAAHFLNKQIDMIVCDVSFISVKLALPPALKLVKEGAQGVFLIKPQFEAGREAIGKGGLIKDPAIVQAVVNDIKTWLEFEQNWLVKGCIPASIKGTDGNQEYVIFAEKSHKK